MSQPPQEPEIFATGDKVKIIGNHYRAVNPPSGTVQIDDVDEDGDYLIDGNWYAYYDVVAADPPTMPAPPKFSSPEEADAWLEEQLKPKPPEVTRLRYDVRVYAANGDLLFEHDVQVMVDAPDPVATALAVAVREWPFMQPVAGNQPTSPAPF